MLKKQLVGLVFSLGLISSAVANDALKAEMGTMAGSLSAAEMGFYSNDKKSALSNLLQLKKEVHKTIGDEKTITNLLPEELKYKASIAINSARLIEQNIDEIEATLKDKDMRMINRQMRTQKALLEIQTQCFRCHNLVRDWE